ncbi:MaoC family dehydratase [Nocardia cyriacigeorgica]|uniref:MaoC family dehydratase n=1 Tax=Nocardia cyriacigeorgica TaxID=135487 RepID=UPI001895DF98|nr:MaoC family dehydratase [Nocardia cyriacigeorgica]MBF6088415.1 MaoC family dehydratase [Nocardia cyriacigeorgica]MBF6095521.1 MaoC family dehydratase [Nocardia cyriacigeorgica]MBF6396704.1 MaoC family dehydratase [Nocardia cyriacigeorgica]MBF6402336.1 MaoC family dehydratase [Nocardia cyriacigeorgica]
MTRVFTSLDDIRAALGEQIGPSEPLVVDQERITAFADATGDQQWIHVDPERAATGPYGTTIAHGYLTLSLLPHFGRSLVSFEFGSARINYGVNKVRFPAAVPAGSELHASVTLSDIAESPAGALVTTKYVVWGGASKPACVAETLVLIVE